MGGTNLHKSKRMQGVKTPLNRLVAFIQNILTKGDEYALQVFLFVAKIVQSFNRSTDKPISRIKAKNEKGTEKKVLLSKWIAWYFFSKSVQYPKIKRDYICVFSRVLSSRSTVQLFNRSTVQSFNR